MYEQTKRATEAQLALLVEARLNSSSRIGTEYEFFWKSITSVVTDGGKRFRPYLAMIGNGRYSDNLVLIATAWELIHIAMLIHDDVIDQDTTRHGHDNINGIYNKRYARHLPAAQQVHYAHSAAILAGDALISEAYKMVVEAPIPNEAKLRVINRLHQAIYEVLGGELLDVEAPIFEGDAAIDPLVIYRYKTASYSFIGPLLSGADCAEDTTPKTLEALEAYGEAIGIGFQLQDDLLGVFGDEAMTGKSTLTDLREGKITYLVAIHKRTMNDTQAHRFSQCFGNPDASENALQSLKQDMIDSGAKQATEALAATYFQAAQNAIAHLTNEQQKSELTALLARLDKRKA